MRLLFDVVKYIYIKLMGKIGIAIRVPVAALFALFFMGCDDGRSSPVDAESPDAVAPDSGFDAAIDGAAEADAARDGGVDAAVQPGPDAQPGPTPDAGPDAVVRTPDEWPTEGLAELVGAEDLIVAVPEGVARAGRIDADEERLTGPEARCQVGDFRLDNAQIGGCIQDARNFSILSFEGGNLVDAHRADRPGTDLFQEVLHLAGFATATVDAIGIVRDGSEGAAAIVRTVGRPISIPLIEQYLPNTFLASPLRMTTEYRLEPDATWFDVLTWWEADEGPAAAAILSDLVFFGDQTEAVFPGASEGESADGAFPFIGAWGERVSYGWSHPRRPVEVFSLPIGALPLAPVRHETTGFGRGDVVLAHRRIHVGTGDIESVRPVVDGAVDVAVAAAPSAHIAIDDADGIVTSVRVDEDGQGMVRLVPGAYAARLLAWDGGDVEPVAFEVAEEGGGAVILAPPLPGYLELTVEDESGAGLAARVEMTGSDSRVRFVVDSGRFALPAGEWNLSLSHGWHYTAHQGTVLLAPGETVARTVTLTRVIDTPGFATGEFHQHASPSTDSARPVTTLVQGNLAAGIDFMVPSDHDVVFDYAGLVAALGWSDRIGVPMTGAEVSPLPYHLGAYGLPYDPDANGGGSVRVAVLEDDGTWRVRRAPELVEAARAMGARLVTLNHPRASQGYFDEMEYSSEVDVALLDPLDFTVDFDGVEVFNESSDGDTCRVLADWLGLLNQGVRITGIGNSDTHTVGSPVGYPRNYVPTLADPAMDVTADEIATALETGSITVGGGAVIDFPEGPMLGDEIAVDGDTLSVRVRLRTPPYARITRLLVVFNGVLVEEIAVDEAVEAIVDFDEIVEVPTPNDGHLVFFAVGDEQMLRYAPSRFPFAFANPIWIDRDGGGVAPIGAGLVEPFSLPWCE